jgi:hypothetical protein
VEAMGQFLAGIAQRLEVADGVWVLKRSHGVVGPLLILPLGDRSRDWVISA